MSSSKLSAADREFFTLLGGVVFGNPFDPKRHKLIWKLAPDAPRGEGRDRRVARIRASRPTGR